MPNTRPTNVTVDHQWWTLTLGLSFIAMLIMKGTGTVTWSWWWITMPLWVVPAIVLGFCVGFAAVWLLVKGITLAAVGIWWCLSPKYRARRRLHRALYNAMAGAVGLKPKGRQANRVNR